MASTHVSHRRQLCMRIAKISIGIVCIVAGILIYPSPFHPRAAIARWSAFLWARSFSSRLQSASGVTIECHNQSCEGRRATGLRGHTVGGCIHSASIHRELQNAKPVGGDWSIPVVEFGGMHHYGACASDGTLDLDGTEYRYHLLRNGGLFIVPPEGRRQILYALPSKFFAGCAEFGGGDDGVKPK